MADAIEADRAAIQQANDRDMEAAAEAGLSNAMLDRLKLDDKRIADMAKGLREVAALPDPVGRVLNDRTRPNGLRLQKISTPIGVVVIIYESRPNVTADAASLCFKSGNATILRGGREALHSNQAIAESLVRAATRQLPAFPAHAIQVVPTTDREAIRELLSLTQYVDLCMPRGGEGLIRAVADVSKVPVIKHYKGVCHVYVDADADLKMAEEIAFNAKCQRPAVCNAMETLLVDRAVAPSFLPAIGRRLQAKKVELRADDASRKILEAEPRPWRRRAQSRLRTGLFHRIQRLHFERPRGRWRRARPSTTSTITAPRIPTALSPATRPMRASFWPRSIPRPFIGTPPPGSPTARNSAWAPRSGSAPTKSARAARWVWRN